MSTHSPPAILSRDLLGVRATLVGLGRRTNVALARYLTGHGAIVRISERKTAAELSEELALLADNPVDLRLGGHRESDVDDTDIVFVTPGAPRDLPILEVARWRGIPVSNEIELLFARCAAPIIGITGSAGKTTTTTLVGQMLEGGRQPVYVGGNIGFPLIDKVDSIEPDARVVLELSSYQLETLSQSPRIGAILNVTPNHLDRHSTFDHYRESKFNLLRFQQPADTAVLGRDDPVASNLASRCHGSVRWFSFTHEETLGAFRRNDDLVVRDEAGEFVVGSVRQLRVPGPHNVLNILAAAAIARASGGAPARITQVAERFDGVEHRLEFVRRIDDVEFVNDSIATSPERTVAALRSFNRPVVLIAGGRSKHLPLGELAAEITQRCRAIVAIGEMADEIVEAISASSASGALLIHRQPSLGEAVVLARGLARPGDVVLLSPAATSFDQFRDFEERGRHFKGYVAALMAAN